MQKWEYRMFYQSLTVKEERKNGEWAAKREGGTSSTFMVRFDTLWNAPWQEKPAFDLIKEFGQEGWELISMTPYLFNGYIKEILFTFKRPLVEEEQG